MTRTWRDIIAEGTYDDMNRLISERDAAHAELARLRGALETWRDELNMDESDVTNTNVIWRRVNRILDPEQETT